MIATRTLTDSSIFSRPFPALPDRTLGILAVIGATVIWGSSSVATKAELDELSPMLLVFARVAVAYLSLLGDDALAADVWMGVGAHNPAQQAAEDLAVAAWGADRSFFLLNGSSCGTHAFLLATLGPGDEVIVAHDVH